MAQDQAISVGRGGGIERRRSQRILLRVPVRIYANFPDAGPLYLEASTETVSAHGALLNMPKPIEMGTRLMLTNLVTEEEIVCRVVFSSRTKEGQDQIAIEFLDNAPRFWRVAFPPPDEKPLKRFGFPPEPAGALSTS
jgi:hypothetical protein